MCFHVKPLKDSQLLTHSYIPTPTLMQTVKTRRQRWNSYFPCEMSVSWCQDHTKMCVQHACLAHSHSLYCWPQGNYASQHLLGLFMCALKKDLDTCHSSVTARALPAWGDRDQSSHSIRAVWDAGHTRARQQMQGEIRKASRKWCCLCHVWSGWGKEGFSRQR